MFGYDFPRLHAAINDLPPALLLASVAFDLLGAFTKRESLKAAGFWTLIFGATGAAASVVTGLLAEDRVEHAESAHALMETHEAFAWVILGLFGVLAIWRLLRRGVWSEKEQPIALTAGVIGLGLLLYMTTLGGKLVFEHATGIPSTSLRAVAAQREAEGADEEGEPHEHRPAAGRPTAVPAGDASPRDTSHVDSVPHSPSR